MGRRTHYSPRPEWGGQGQLCPHPQSHCHHCFLPLGNFLACRPPYIYLIPAKRQDRRMQLVPFYGYGNCSAWKGRSQSHPAKWQNQTLDISPTWMLKACDPHCPERVSTSGFGASVPWPPLPVVNITPSAPAARAFSSPAYNTSGSTTQPTCADKERH